MALKTSSTGITYNPNTDYSKLMKSYLERGGKETDPTYQIYQKRREAKIADASPEQLAKWGINYYNPQTGIDVYNGQITEKVMLNTDDRGNVISTTNVGTGVTTPYQGNVGSEFANTLSQQPIQYQLPQRPDLSGMIRDRYANLRTSLLSKIDQALAQGLAGYQGLDEQIRRQTREGLNQNDIELARTLQSIYEATEATGGYRGGENITGQIAARTQGQQIAGLLRQDEATRLAELAKAIEALKQQAEQEKIATEADIGAREAADLLAAEQWGADYDLRALEQAFNQDLASRQFDFSKEVEQERQRLEWAKFNASKEWQDFQKQFQLDEQAWARNENNPQVRAQILANEITRLKLLNLPRELQLEVQRLEQELAQGRVSMEEARARIQNMQVQANLEQQRLDLSRQQQLNTQSQQRINQYKNMIDQLYAMPDPNTGAVTYNRDGIRQYLRNLNVTGQISDDEARILLGMYGFSY